MQRLRTLMGQVLAKQQVADGARLQAVRCSSSSDLAKEMAPTGKLRVALNMRNKLVVSSKTPEGEPDGLAPTLARTFAASLGVPVEFVPYETPAAIFKDAGLDKWDVGMVGSDPARAEFVNFTAPYCQIEATYAVPADSKFQHCDEVDKDGVRVAGCAGAAYVLWLERNFKNGKLEIIEGHGPTYEHFLKNELDACAGLRSNLTKDAAQLPGTRLLEGKFMAVEQAACTKKGREAGFKSLSAFIDEAKASGEVLRLMKHFGVNSDLTVPE